MIDIVDDGSKESKKAIALAVATQAKYKFGNGVEKILDWLIGKSCVEGKSEIPDFIINGSSGVVGIEHFEVAANSVMINDKWQSPLAEASMALYNYGNNKPVPDLDKKLEKHHNTVGNTTYYSSIHVFKDIFEKHLKKAEQYRKRLSVYDANRLVFLVEMLSWEFIGLTAIGKKTFDCNFIKIPLCRDIVDIIATADSVDAVVLLFNNYPNNDSTVFAFTPQQAKDDSIDVEIYEYAGNDEKSAIRNVCNKAFNLISSGKSCIVDTRFYNMLIQERLIPDERV
jgi:hypothetical protein